MAWRRSLNASRETAPVWTKSEKPLVGWLDPTEPDLAPGENRVFVGLAIATRGWWDLRGGIGSLWLTDRRLIFQRPRGKASPIEPRRIEIPRNEMRSVAVRSLWRSLMSGGPFLGSFEVKTTDGKTYVVNTAKASNWVSELSATQEDRRR
jgi:hypothetical protein